MPLHHAAAISIAISVVVGSPISASISATSRYIKERKKLKEGDKEIERDRQVELQSLGSTLPSNVTHLLHEHPLALQNSGPAFECSACIKDGPNGSRRYTCTHHDDCDFNVHTACALSDQLTASWQAKDVLSTSAHKQMDVELVQGSTTFTCSQCINEGTNTLRYRCKDDGCSKRFHVICANNPTMLLTFLHPNHVLELRARHRFRACDICLKYGKPNTRVYSCEGCFFCVHPECAHCLQFYNHPSHGHALVYRKLSKKETTPCQICGLLCKGWSYACPQCQGFALHRGCLGDSRVVSHDKHANGVADTPSEVIGQIASDLAKDAFVKGLTAAITGSPV